MGIEVVLVRHGQTVWNAEERLAGWTDVALTALGRSQAGALRPALEGERFEGVWSSDLQRAVETARLAYGEPSTDRRLREMNFGALEGERWRELDARHALGLKAFEGFEAPQGESIEALEARVLGFMGELASGRHLIFTHGGVIRLLTRRLGKVGFVGNCARVVVDWSGQRLIEELPLAP